MKNKTEVTEKPLLLKVSDTLLHTQRELDELAVQLALGKAEARDSFEEIKKELRARISNVKHTIKSKVLTESAVAIQTKLDELEVQLSLGKADTKEALQEQGRKISHAVHVLENHIKNAFPEVTDLSSFSHDIEKFKLKLELLHIKTELKKFEIKDSFKDSMLQARKTIESLKKAANDELQAKSETYGNFKTEVHDAYQHLRRALKEL